MTITHSDRRICMFSKYVWCSLIFLGIGLAGCVPFSGNGVKESDSSLSSERSSLIVFDETEIPSNGFNTEDTRMENITLWNALSLTLLKNPVLSAFSWELRAGEARIIQAGLYPNPELSVEMENFGGKRELNDFDSTETTFKISQLIELGDKRNKRKRLMALESALVRWDYVTTRNHIFAQVKRAFVNILIAQKRLSLIKELICLDEQVLETVSERVRAGKASPVEKTKAEVLLASNRIRQENASNELDIARQKLASYFGEKEVWFKCVTGDIDKIIPVPPIEQLTPELSKNPDIARWQTELRKNQANIEMRKSRVIPDITLDAGFRWFNEGNDNYGFVTGLTIPLPLFDRNQGSIQEAQFLLEKARKEMLNAEVKLASKFIEAYKRLSLAYSGVNSLKEHILPGAQDTFNASNEGFKEGKISYLQLLDAQRILFDSEMQYLEAISSYHHAVIDMEQLITQSLFKKNEYIQ